MGFVDRCGNCVYYEFEGDDKKGYCSWYKCYYYPGDSCSHQKNGESSSSSCYITTIVCDVLGFEDDCAVLNTLRGFRNDVLQKNTKYLPILMEYDVVGPNIADLINDEYKKTQDKEMWIQLYNFYLVPTANLVNEGKNDEAVKRYREMVNSLKEYYGLSDTFIQVDNYDVSQGGHGKVKKLSTDNC